MGPGLEHDTKIELPVIKRILKLIRSCEQSRTSLDRRLLFVERNQDRKRNAVYLESLRREDEIWWAVITLLKFAVGEGLPEDYRAKVLPGIVQIIDDLQQEES